MNYMPRIADGELAEKLDRMSAVLVRGPKWCGKTSTCMQLAKSELWLRDPDTYASSMEAASIQPSLLLRGERPRLLDEWQVAPVLWDAVISEADALGGKPGQFMLTGSATPLSGDMRKAVKHTGTGRIARVDMDPMTLSESGHSSCEVSLGTLFAGTERVEGVSHLTVEDYAELICAGGWPAPIACGTLDVDLAKDYIAALCDSDVAEAVEESVDPDRVRSLLRSIARNTTQQVTNATLAADVEANGLGMSEPTLRKYLAALRRLFIVRESPAWAPSLRSKTPLRVSPTMYFCDPSLAAAALDADPEALLSDLETMGFLFENLCVRDLRVYMRSLNGGVFHYRDKTGLEADAIVRLNNSRWGAIEIKLGGERRIEEAAEHLTKLVERVDVGKSGEPAFLMVLTGGRYAYTRPDGVQVVPLGCLGR